MNVYFGMTAEQAEKLKSTAGKAIVSESEALRGFIDGYLAVCGKKGLPYEPYGKMKFIGYEDKVFPRTISREQDARLRDISQRTGRSLSELIREAIERG